MAKAKKKSKAKKPAKKSKSVKKRPARAAAAKGKVKSKVKAKKSKKAAPAKKPAKKVAKKAPAKKKKQIVGEGDYAASRSFLKDQSSFVKRNQGKIEALGKAAEKALDGPEGGDLRAAEEEAKSHSKVSGPEE